MASHHPRLWPQLPILDRTPTEIQVGAHNGLVLPDRPEVRQALSLLDGQHALGEIADTTGLPRAQLRTLIKQLGGAGLLAPGRPRGPNPLVRLLGSGALARAFAEAYAESAVGDLLLVDPAPAPAGLYPQTASTGGETLRNHLRARGHTRIRCAPHWYRPDGPAPILTVIAHDRLECDRAITDTLLRADQPHLFLRPLPEGIIVGPLVVPGATCCTRCMDLVRARDRAWPRLLAQLCLTECPPQDSLLPWAAATTLLQVRAWLSGNQPETLGSTLEIRAGRWVIEQRHWPHHPDCGCTQLRATN
ncbi:MAG: hypothetical protein Q4F67_01805 [Propionibacteriaceae bacterium]|nr:hypothetical protein [Propionibacteriaceae bacterium]